MGKMNTSVQLSSIQALRGLAAFGVLLAHLAGIENKYSPDRVLPNEFQIGFAGVDLFFVISGFVMVYVSRNRFGDPAHLPDFVFARVWRIYPPYWLYTALAIAAFMIIYGLPWDPTDLEGRDGWAHLLASFTLWPQPGLPVLITGWTLVHEMYFYLVFALMFLVPVRHVPIALAGWGLFVLLGSLAGWGTGSAVLAIVFHPLTFEFLLGAAVGLAWIKAIRWPAVPCLIAGLIWLAGSLLLREQAGGEAFPAGYERVLMFAPPALTVLMAALALEARGDWKVPKWMVALGDWSYSLYLSHILVLSAIARFFWPSIMSDGPVDNVVALLAMAAASVVFAALAYRLFEAPLLRAGRGIRARYVTKAKTG